MQYSFPAIFEQEEDAVIVTFPDEESSKNQSKQTKKRHLPPHLPCHLRQGLFFLPDAQAE